MVLFIQKRLTLLPRLLSLIIERKTVTTSYYNSMTYPWVRERVAQGTLLIHRWFFDAATGTIQAYSPTTHRYERIDEKRVQVFLKGPKRRKKYDKK